MLSAHIADGGRTVMYDGSKVTPSERGKGVSKLIHKDSLERLKTSYPKLEKQSFVTANVHFLGSDVICKQVQLTSGYNPTRQL